MNDLFGISHLCSDINRPGVETIRYVPTLWIDRANYEEYVFADGKIRALPLMLGRQWLTMPIIPLADQVNIWDENMEVSSQGEIFNQRIQGIIPAHSPTLALELQKMWGLKFIVEPLNLNGLKFQVGTIQTPLTFTANYSSQRGGHIFSFSGRTKTKSYGSSNG